MYILIPLGGLGLRFKELGYKVPKSLINVFGKSILFWLLDNLNLKDNITQIIIPYNKELARYNFEDLIKKKYPNNNFKFICLEKNTDGATETILYALSNMNLLDLPILLLDGDNFYTVDIVNKWGGKNNIMVFNDYSNEPIYSYINFDSDNYLTDIKEKEKISNYACTGAYCFESVFTLKEYCELVLKNNIRSKNEFYTSTTINQMIKANIKFQYTIIETKNYICLGTPLQVRLFCNGYPKINAFNNELMIKPLRLCFDLDNTLVTYPEIPNDYTTVKPITANINFLHYLKKFSHTIIIYTARRMKTSGGNIGSVNKSIGKITFDTLEKFSIPYDEIYFGKPYADYYIDDLAINAFDSLEKELGFYQNNIDPREFNTISKNTIDIIKKESTNSLEGEILYYLNIPNTVKDMFPLMINHDTTNYKWYNLELIDGIPISKLFLSEELTIQQFDNILNSIIRLHGANKSLVLPTDLNIYLNYSNKLTKRYQEYDYSIFPDSEIIFNNIISELKTYEENNLGKISVIHGDPVFTNIIINKYGKIKFIDMRGKINDMITIYGDELYDWGKIYQSLIGYDEILDNKNLNFQYKNKFINLFENKILSLYNKTYLNYIKLITKSLLFSLIPLHNNNKCTEYFNLIKNILYS